MRRLVLGGALAPLILLVTAATAPAPVLASCMPLDLAAVQRTEGTTIFAGTVTVVQADHVFMRVEAWFVGANPVEDAEIIGGRDPNVVTSVDWMPAAGGRYLVVAERQAPNGFVTKPCQQMSIDAGVIERATAVLGPPQAPPFGTPGPAATGGESPVGGPMETLPWLVVLGVAVLSALLALLARRQRGRRPSSS